MNENLYQKAIVEAAARGAENRRLADPGATATVDNPLCGDRVTMDVRTDGRRVAAVGYRTRGCKLCEASTALLAEAMAGQDRATIVAARAALRAMLEREAPPPWASFAVFAPVRRHASRHSCVLLPFDALAQALEG